MNRVYVSVGSNHHAENNLRQGIALLREQVKIIAISPVYETAPVGENAGSAPYLNAVIVFETELDPVSLKENVLVEVENQLGRVRGQKGTPVALDLDILLFNKEQYDFGRRQIPDPDIEHRAYIALPLADVAPDMLHPLTGVSFRETARRFSNSEDILLRGDIQL